MSKNGKQKSKVRKEKVGESGRGTKKGKKGKDNGRSKRRSNWTGH